MVYYRLSLWRGLVKEIVVAHCVLVACGLLVAGPSALSEAVADAVESRPVTADKPNAPAPKLVDSGRSAGQELLFLHNWPTPTASLTVDAANRIWGYSSEIGSSAWNVTEVPEVFDGQQLVRYDHFLSYTGATGSVYCRTPDGQITTLSLPSLHPEFTSQDVLITSLVVAEDVLWLGTNRGLFRGQIEPAPGGSGITIANGRLYTVEDGLAGTWVTCLADDSDWKNSIYVGSRDSRYSTYHLLATIKHWDDPGGVTSIEASTGNVGSTSQAVQDVAGAWIGVVGATVNAITLGVWAATEAGINLLSPSNLWPGVYTQIPSIPATSLRTLYEGAGILWAGTDQGLARYAGGNWSIHGPHDETLSSSVSEIVYHWVPDLSNDGANFLWLAVNGALADFDLDRLVWEKIADVGSPEEFHIARAADGQLLINLDRAVYRLATTTMISIQPIDGAQFPLSQEENAYINFVWEPVQDATGYELFWRKLPDGEFVGPVSTTDSSYAMYLPEGEFEWYVRAVLPELGPPIQTPVWSLQVIDTSLPCNMQFFLLIDEGDESLWKHDPK